MEITNFILLSVIFLFVNKPNKPSETVKDNILKHLKANLKFLQEELPSDDESLEQDEDLAQEKMRLVFSKLFISNEKQVFILDESDKGESRTEIFEVLSKLSPIESSRFNFENFYSNTLKGFDFNLIKFIDEMLNKIKSHAIEDKEALQKVIELEKKYCLVKEENAKLQKTQLDQSLKITELQKQLELLMIKLDNLQSYMDSKFANEKDQSPSQNRVTMY